MSKENPSWNYSLAAFSPTSGLTKREYFTAAALQGLLASAATDRWTMKHVAAVAVEAADEALYALRSKQT